MYTYSNDKKTDMILVHGGEYLKNTSLDARFYAQRWPERRAPYGMIFKRLEGQLRANRPPVKLSKQRVATDEEHERAVLQIVEEKPHVGQREVARRVAISQSSVCRIANENKFHPYHLALFQGLKEADYPKRLNFCRFVREQIILDKTFLENVFFSDEASFSNNGGVNKHNCHYYAQNSPRWIREGHFQLYKFLVWNIGKKKLGQ
jgi:predicted XRE-type DNA-binding protein